MPFKEPEGSQFLSLLHLLSHTTLFNESNLNIKNIGLRPLTTDIHPCTISTEVEASV
jgi:hypothetical protein